MSSQKEAPIFARNKDVEHIVNAAANYDHYAMGHVADQRLALLITTDVHRDKQRLQNAVDYLNGMEALDAGICLGDMQAGNYAESDGAWYVDTIKQVEKPFFTAIGNHDGGHGNVVAISGTKHQVFKKFIAPLRDCIGIPDLDKTYYAVNFDEYKVTLIILDNYDVTDDRDEAGDFQVSRYVNYLGQAQVDWLIDTLAGVPQDYHVLIARHELPEKGVPKTCSWTNEGYEMDPRISIATSYVVQDIMDAWLKVRISNPKVLPENCTIVGIRK